jgi:hypothetical protein
VVLHKFNLVWREEETAETRDGAVVGESSFNRVKKSKLYYKVVYFADTPFDYQSKSGGVKKTDIYQKRRYYGRSAIFSQ